MKTEKLPTKLNAEPLLDAVCEVRFATTLPAHSILPGLLYHTLNADLPGQIRVEQTQLAQLPPEMRQADPSLQFAALTRIAWGGFAIGIGEASLAVSLIGKYPGWPAFKLAILKVLQAAASAGVLDTVTRFSLKYVDLISVGGEPPIGGLNIRLKIGETDLDRQSAQIRVEIPDAPFTHIVNTLTKAQAKLVTGEVKFGSLVDVDTVSLSGFQSREEFLQQMPVRLDDAHIRNKRIFFECLTPETLQQLGPRYD